MGNTHSQNSVHNSSNRNRKSTASGTLGTNLNNIRHIDSDVESTISNHSNHRSVTQDSGSYAEINSRTPSRQSSNIGTDISFNSSSTQSLYQSNRQMPLHGDDHYLSKELGKYYKQGRNIQVPSTSEGQEAENIYGNAMFDEAGNMLPGTLSQAAEWRREQGRLHSNNGSYRASSSDVNSIGSMLDNGSRRSSNTAYAGNMSSHHSTTRSRDSIVTDRNTHSQHNISYGNHHNFKYIDSDSE